VGFEAVSKTEKSAADTSLTRCRLDFPPPPLMAAQ